MSLAKTTNQKQATESRPDEKEKVCMIQCLFNGATTTFPHYVPKSEFFDLINNLVGLDKSMRNDKAFTIYIEGVFDMAMEISQDFHTASGLFNTTETMLDYCRKELYKRQGDELTRRRFLFFWASLINGLLQVGRIQDDSNNGFIFIEEPEKYSKNELTEMIIQELKNRELIAEQKKAKNDKKRKAKKAKKTAGQTETETEQRMREMEQRMQQDETRAMECEDINQAVKHLECGELFAIAHPCYDYDCEVSLDIMEHITVEGIVVRTTTAVEYFL
jgi:hypothetical protein